MISIESLFMRIGAVVGSAGLGWIANNHSIPFAWNQAGTVFCFSTLFYLRFLQVEKREEKG